MESGIGLLHEAVSAAHAHIFKALKGVIILSDDILFCFAGSAA